MHDFVLETEQRAVDVSLVLPHYRARNQPLGHRLSMFVGSERGDSVKVKVVRPKFRGPILMLDADPPRVCSAGVFSPHAPGSSIWR